MLPRPRWGTKDAEIMLLSVNNPELSRVPSFSYFKSGVGQNIALHAIPTARNFAFLIA